MRFLIWTETAMKLFPLEMLLRFRKNGTVKLEMLLEKTSRTVETRAGMTIGSVTRRRILNLLALSTVAASSRLASMLRRIPPMRMYANGA